MSNLSFGVIGTSRKENERRVPIHPEHLPRIPQDVRRQLIFEEGYGAPFGIADSEIAGQTGGIATRHELLTDIGNVIIPKPVISDLEELREGGILWGWPHCVQQWTITQTALAADGVFPVTAPAGAGPAPGKPAAEPKIVRHFNYKIRG